MVAPVGSVMKNTTVVVAPEAGRGFGFAVCAVGLGDVGDGGCVLAGGGETCNNVSINRATMTHRTTRLRDLVRGIRISTVGLTIAALP